MREFTGLKGNIPFRVVPRSAARAASAYVIVLLITGVTYIDLLAKERREKQRGDISHYRVMAENVGRREDGTLDLIRHVSTLNRKDARRAWILLDTTG